MKAKKTMVGLLGMWFMHSILGTPLAFALTVGGIAQELTCTCGCNMVVSACEGAMQCSAAENIKNEIIAKLNRGESKDAILSSFVRKYGETILSAPTKRGFNLTAWILPFVAVISGIGIIYLLLRKWASRTRPTSVVNWCNDEDGAYCERIEKELETFGM